MSERMAISGRRRGPSFTAPEGQSATFVELFFDLVFVFALTEITALTLHHLDWEGAARSLLIFWLIWWTWDLWAWALNSANTEHWLVQVTTLAATAVAFIMATSVGDALGDDGGLWFAIPYVVVRAGGLGMVLSAASENAERLKAVRRYALAAIPGIGAIIIGGFVDSDTRLWIWLGAICMDMGALFFASTGQEGWTLNAGHFVERRALFVIIVLGESLVVVGAIVADAEPTTDLIIVAIGAVVVTCLLWWTYFGWLRGALEAQLEREPLESQVLFGRDVFTLLHFPVIGGVIPIAVGFEKMVLHPGEPLQTAGTVALGLGLVLFIGGSAMAWARAGRQLLLPRLTLLTALVVALVFAADAQPAVVLAILAVAIASIAIIEQVQHPRRKSASRYTDQI